MSTKTPPRSYLPLVTLRDCAYYPGACRVSAKPGTAAAHLRLDYPPRRSVIACHVPTQPTYYLARKYAEQELLPAQSYEEYDEGGDR